MPFSGQYENRTTQGMDLNSLLNPHPLSTYFLKMTGDAMIDAGIRPGDILAVDRSRIPADGQIVVAEREGGLLVRLFKSAAGKAVLKTCRSGRAEIVPVDGETLLWGVVSAVVRKY